MASITSVAETFFATLKKEQVQDVLQSIETGIPVTVSDVTPLMERHLAAALGTPEWSNAVEL